MQKWTRIIVSVEVRKKLEKMAKIRFAKDKDKKSVNQLLELWLCEK